MLKLFNVPKSLIYILCILIPVDIFLLINGWFGFIEIAPKFLIIFLLIFVPLIGCYWVYVSVFRFLGWRPFFLLIFWFFENVTIVSYMYDALKTMKGGGSGGADALLLFLYGHSIVLVLLFIKIFPLLGEFFLNFYPVPMQRLDSVTDVLMSCLIFSVFGLIQALCFMTIGWLISKPKVGRL